MAGTCAAWVVPVSETATRTHNPIRKIVESMKKPDLPDKPHIPLSLGDPTVFGNLITTDVLTDAVAKSLASGKHNGYIHSAGDVEARRAVAAYCSVPGKPALTVDDVVIASGCSGALDLAITVLLNPGDNLLIPKPAFSLYETLCGSKGIGVQQYSLLPDRQWEADLVHLESLINARTRAILVNNPSNPCGSVYTAEHLTAIIAIAQRHRIPIIADEIYGDMVFPSAHRTFVPMASLTDVVPILSTGGIAKLFLVPGWRVGWVALHDRAGALSAVRSGLFSLSQLILGANSLVLSALPDILNPVKGSEQEAKLAKFHADVLTLLEENAVFTAARIGAIPGLTVVKPQGAMYVMFGIDPTAFKDIDTDVTFGQRFLAEENVALLPGACFHMPNYLRVVFCAPRPVLEAAFDRLAAFCDRHRK